MAKDETKKLHMQLNDTFAFTHADGKVVDTCKYKTIIEGHAKQNTIAKFWRKLWS
jgi:hypothetical protein